LFFNDSLFGQFLLVSDVLDTEVGEDKTGKNNGEYEQNTQLRNGSFRKKRHFHSSMDFTIYILKFIE
jgi:hypothetical protein